MPAPKTANMPQTLYNKRRHYSSAKAIRSYVFTRKKQFSAILQGRLRLCAVKLPVFAGTGDGIGVSPAVCDICHLNLPPVNCRFLKYCRTLPVHNLQIENSCFDYSCNTSCIVVASLKLTPNVLKCAFPQSNFLFSDSRRLSRSSVLFVSRTR